MISSRHGKIRLALRCLIARALILVLLPGSLVASSLTYMRLGRHDIERRLKVTPGNQKDALNRFRAQLVAAGVDPRQIREQPVPGAQSPNVIVTFPGKEPGIILVAASSSIPRNRTSAAVQWGTLEMMELLAESWMSVRSQHTLVLLAYPGDISVKSGLQVFLEEAGKMDRSPGTMVMISELGRVGLSYWTHPRDAVLGEWLQVAARELRLPPPEGSVISHAFSDASARIIRIWSNNSTLIWTVPDGPPVRMLRDKIDLQRFQQSYETLCVFLTELDHRAEETQARQSRGQKEETERTQLTLEQAEQHEAEGFARALANAGLPGMKSIAHPELREIACGLAQSKSVNESADPWIMPEFLQAQKALLQREGVLYSVLDVTGRPGDIEIKTPENELRQIADIARQKGLIPVGYSVAGCPIPIAEGPPRWWMAIVVSGVAAEQRH